MKYIKLIIAFTLLFIYNINNYIITANNLAPKDKKEEYNLLLHNVRKNAFDEKLYLHTDKEFYSAGDTILFKGYLYDTNKFRAGNSTFIYVELIDETKQVIKRLKFKGENGAFKGQMPLDLDINEGNYYLRSYSWWMLNLPTDFLFVKKLKIGNGLGLSSASFVKYNKSADGAVEATVTFVDRNNIPIENAKVNLSKRIGKNRNKVEKYTTNSNGEIVVKFNSEFQKSEFPYFDVNINTEVFKHSRQFALPELDNSFEIDFFPESGYLIEGQAQVMAFKAIGKNGLSVSVKGVISDSKGDTISEFETSHNGMGRFYLFPVAGDEYTAIVRTESGEEVRKKLPKTQEAVVLKCIMSKNNLLCSVFNTTQISNDSLSVAFINRDNIVLYQNLKTLTNNFLKINTSYLPTGITNIVVLDNAGRKLSERLIYIPEPNYLNLAFNTDKESYSKRDKISATFCIKDINDKPISGDFSVSVTNSRLSPSSKLNSNIVSHFFLTSDIKGHVEDPMQYFENNDVKTIEKMDILLMTQAWKRYDIEQILTQKKVDNPYYMEMGQSIGGTIKNFGGSPKKDASVFLISQSLNNLYSTVSGKSGEFLFEGIDFPENSIFFLKTKNPKISMNLLSVEVEDQKFPVVNNLPKHTDWIDDNTKKEYLFTSKEKVYTTSDGLRLIELDEVEIVSKKEAETFSESLYSFSNMSYDANQLKNYESYTLEAFLMTLPKIGRVMNDYVRGEKSVYIDEEMGTEDFYSPVIFCIDEQETDYDIVRTTQMSDIANLSVVTDIAQTSAFDSSGRPIVFLKLKDNVQLGGNYTQPSMVMTTPLGYTPAVEFYSPKYDVPIAKNKRKSDLRTTVFWKNDLITNKEDGRALFDFYTGDIDDDLNVIIEGITDSGTPCYYESVIKLKN